MSGSDVDDANKSKRDINDVLSPLDDLLDDSFDAEFDLEMEKKKNKKSKKGKLKRRDTFQLIYGDDDDDEFDSDDDAFGSDLEESSENDFLNNLNNVLSNNKIKPIEIKEDKSVESLNEVSQSNNDDDFIKDDDEEVFEESIGEQIMKKTLEAKNKDNKKIRPETAKRTRVNNNNNNEIQRQVKQQQSNINNQRNDQHQSTPSNIQRKPRQMKQKSKQNNNIQQNYQTTEDERNENSHLVQMNPEALRLVQMFPSDAYQVIYTPGRGNDLSSSSSSIESIESPQYKYQQQRPNYSQHQGNGIRSNKSIRSKRKTKRKSPKRKKNKLHTSSSKNILGLNKNDSNVSSNKTTKSKKKKKRRNHHLIKNRSSNTPIVVLDPKEYPPLSTFKTPVDSRREYMSPQYAYHQHIHSSHHPHHHHHHHIHQRPQSATLTRKPWKPASPSYQLPKSDDYIQNHPKFQKEIESYNNHKKHVSFIESHSTGRKAGRYYYYHRPKLERPNSAPRPPRNGDISSATWTYDPKTGRRRMFTEKELENIRKYEKWQRWKREKEKTMTLSERKRKLQEKKEKRIRKKKAEKYIDPEPTIPDYPTERLAGSTDRFIRNQRNQHQEMKKKEAELKKKKDFIAYTEREMDEILEKTTPVVWAEYKQMEDDDVIVTVEHCVDCHKHNMTTKHDPMLYADNAISLLRDLLTTLLPCPIRFALLRKASSIKLFTKWNRVLSIKNLHRRLHQHAQRIGAFEVQVCIRRKGKIKIFVLHSKLIFKTWGHWGHIKKRLINALRSTGIWVHGKENDVPPDFEYDGYSWIGWMKNDNNRDFIEWIYDNRPKKIEKEEENEDENNEDENKEKENENNSNINEEKTENNENNENNEDNNNDEFSPVSFIERWLFEQHPILAQYGKPLVEEGFDSLEALRMLTLIDIQSIEEIKPGHYNLLIAAIHGELSAQKTSRSQLSGDESEYEDDETLEMKRMHIINEIREFLTMTHATLPRHAESLYEVGVRSVPNDILKLEYEDLLEIDGIPRGHAKLLSSAITKKKKNAAEKIANLLVRWQDTSKKAKSERAKKLKHMLSFSFSFNEMDQSIDFDYDDAMVEEEKVLDESKYSNVSRLAKRFRLRVLAQVAKNIKDADGLTLDVEDGIEDVYHILDKDGDDELNDDELKGALTSFQLDIEPNDLEKFRACFDINGDGGIGLTEFLTFLLSNVNGEELGGIWDIIRQNIIYSDYKIEELDTALFLPKDENKNGRISPELFEECIKKLYLPLKQPDIDLLKKTFRAVSDNDFDTNKNPGEVQVTNADIDYICFVSWLNPIHMEKLTKRLSRFLRSVASDNPEGEEVGIKELFESLDEDGSGEIDINEFRESINRLGLPLEFIEARAIILQFSDGNGNLEYDQFHGLVARREWKRRGGVSMANVLKEVFSAR